MRQVGYHQRYFAALFIALTAGTVMCADCILRLPASAKPVAMKMSTKSVEIKNIQNSLDELKRKHPASVKKIAELYFQLGVLQKSEALYADAQKSFTNCLGIWMTDASNVPLQLHASMLLGDSYREQGNYRAAETYLVRANEFARRHSPNTIDDAIATNRLALLYNNWGLFRKAEPLARQSLAIVRKLAPPQPTEQGIHMLLLADILRQQGKYSEAEPYLLKSVELLSAGSKQTGIATKRNKNNDIKDRSDRQLELARAYAGAINNLGALYFWQGNYDKSAPLLKRGLQMRRQLLGEEHADVANSLGDLGALYYQQSKYREAQNLWEKALSIRQKRFGQNNPLSARLMSNLGNLYATLGQTAKAKAILIRAIKINENSSGSMNTDLAQSLNNLAELYVDEHKFGDAEALYDRVLLIRTSAFGKINADVAASRRSLGRLYMERGDFSKADEQINEARSIFLEIRNFPELADTLDLLGGLKSRQERFDDAAKVYEQALQIRSKEKTPDRKAIEYERSKLLAIQEIQSKIKVIGKVEKSKQNPSTKSPK